MRLYFFYTMVQKSQKWPKTQIKGGSCLNLMIIIQTYLNVEVWNMSETSTWFETCKILNHGWLTRILQMVIPTLSSNCQMVAIAQYVYLAVDWADSARSCSCQGKAGVYMLSFLEYFCELSTAVEEGVSEVTVVFSAVKIKYFTLKQFFSDAQKHQISNQWIFRLSTWVLAKFQSHETRSSGNECLKLSLCRYTYSLMEISYYCTAPD